MKPGIGVAGIDLLIVGMYLAAMLGVGWAVSRRVRTFRDFFVAGGHMTAPLLVCTLVSTYYGLDVLFGGSELGYREGVVAWFAYTRPYYVAILVAAFVIAPRLRRFPFLSLTDALGYFYGNGTRAVGAVASFLYSLPFMAIMGIGVLLDLVMGIPFAWGVLIGATVAVIYTILGGLMAVALTDSLQFVLMCVSLGIATILILNGMGGMEAIEEALPASYFDPVGTFPTLMILVFAASALSVLVEPAFYQRIFAADSYRSVVIALLIGIGLWAAFDWLVTVLGMAAAAQGIEADPRYALLWVTLEVLPVGLTGLFIGGVLATAMSTIDSYLLIAGGNIAYDLYRPLVKPDIEDAALLRLTRYMALVAAAVSIWFALFFQSLVTAWIFMSTLLTATVLVPLAGGLYARRMPRPAAGFASSVCGLLVATGFWILVELRGSHDEEWGSNIWRFTLGGREIELWQEYAVLFALPASALAFVAGQLFGRRPPLHAGHPLELGEYSAGVLTSPERPQL